jgi:hypothetical protein
MSIFVRKTYELTDKLIDMASLFLVHYVYFKLAVRKTINFNDIEREELGEKTNAVAQEPESSSPHLPQPATGPCPEQSNPIDIPQASLPKIHSDPIFLPTPWSSRWPLSIGLSHQNLVHFSVLSHACYMLRSPYSP